MATGPRVVLGNIQPKFTYGFNTKFTYKNLDFFLSLSGSYGNKLFNALACRLDRGNGYYYNPLAEVADRWTPTNPSNTIQKAATATSIYADDRFVEDASYLKFSNIQLGYTVPLKLITPDSKVRFYVSLQNFFTITGYNGYDPEANPMVTTPRPTATVSMRQVLSIRASTTVLIPPPRPFSLVLTSHFS